MHCSKTKLKIKIVIMMLIYECLFENFKIFVIWKSSIIIVIVSWGMKIATIPVVNQSFEL